MPTEVARKSMDNKKNGERLKQEVRNYWNAHPCGTQFTGLQWGSREFFDSVEKHRYETQPFMRKVPGFDRFRNKSLLEIGCGLGTDLLQFARAGARVTGVDLTPQSIELAKKRFALENQAADLRVADAERLPFENETFDAVYSFGVLHHTPNTQRAVDEALRVLKTGGEIIIMVYHQHSLHVWLGTPLYRFFSQTRNSSLSLTQDWVRIYDGEDNPLGKAYTKSEVRSMLNRCTNLKFTTCDPVRRRYPGVINWINQKVFAPWLGFYLIVQGQK